MSINYSYFGFLNFEIKFGFLGVKWKLTQISSKFHTFSVRTRLLWIPFTREIFISESPLVSKIHERHFHTVLSLICIHVQLGLADNVS